MAFTTSSAFGSLLRSTVRYSTPRASSARKVALHCTHEGFVYTVIMGIPVLRPLSACCPASARRTGPTTRCGVHGQRYPHMVCYTSVVRRRSACRAQGVHTRIRLLHRVVNDSRVVRLPAPRAGCRPPSDPCRAPHVPKRSPDVDGASTREKFPRMGRGSLPRPSGPASHLRGAPASDRAQGP